MIVILKTSIPPSAYFEGGGLTIPGPIAPGATSYGVPWVIPQNGPTPPNPQTMQVIQSAGINPTWSLANWNGIVSITAYLWPDF